MSIRREAREKIADILARGEGERSTALWHSDIARLADMLLWLYTDYAKPMVYDKGNAIELSRTSEGKTLWSIEKTPEGYTVNAFRYILKRDMAGED